MLLGMIDVIYIGKLVNTHGIKGEVKIISDFKYKDVVFKIGSNLYIGGRCYVISSYRKHKNFDMVTFEGIDNIDDVISLKGSGVYINRDDFVFDGVLNEDLYGKKVYDKGRFIGVLEEVVNVPSGELLVVISDGKRVLIPYVDEFVKKVDEDIHLELIRGFLDDN